MKSGAGTHPGEEAILGASPGRQWTIGLQYPAWAEVIRWVTAALRPFAVSTVATCYFLTDVRIHSITVQMLCAIFRRQVRQIRERQPVSRGPERRLLCGVSAYQHDSNSVVVLGEAGLPTLWGWLGSFPGRHRRHFVVVAWPWELLRRSTKEWVRLGRLWRYEHQFIIYLNIGGKGLKQLICP